MSHITTHIYPHPRIQLQYNRVWGALHGQTSSSQALMYLQPDETIIRLRYWIYLDYVVRAEFTTSKYEWGVQRTLRSGANPSQFQPGELTLQDVEVCGSSLQTRMRSSTMRTVRLLSYRRGVSVRGVSVWGSLSRGVSVWIGSLSRGVSVQGGLCPGGSLSRWFSVQVSLCPGGGSP